MTVIDPMIKPVAYIDGQAINILSPVDAIARVRGHLRSGRGFTFDTLNLDHLVKRRKDAAFRAAYARATFVSADGAPVAAMARKQAPSLRRTTGADLLRPLCGVAMHESVRVALFGSMQEVLADASVRLRAENPGLDIVFAQSPPFGFEPSSNQADAYGAQIAASGARLCFLCLGAPKQEIFADRMTRRYPEIGFVSVGAAVDYVVRRQIRAPHAAQMLGLEWLWRLCCDPKRLAWRYVECAALVAQILIERRPMNRGTP